YRCPGSSPLISWLNTPWAARDVSVVTVQGRELNSVASGLTRYWKPTSTVAALPRSSRRPSTITAFAAASQRAASVSIFGGVTPDLTLVSLITTGFGH